MNPAPEPRPLEFFIEGEPLLAEPYYLRAVGLPNVWLLNGVTFHDDAYGECYTITDIHGLLQEIVRAVEAGGGLSEAELRFLVQWGESENKGSGLWKCARGKIVN